ncbi:MAG: cellulase family glycosylhydrolase [Chitinophagaceae bacterium]
MSFSKTISTTSEPDSETGSKWSSQRAFEWYKKNGWIIGCNYIPGTAINQLEMWQPETFDLCCIDKELGWAKDIGFNTIRVFLHHLLWEQDAAGFIERINSFLTVAHKHKIKTMFVLFDGVWDPYPKLGKQPDPKHNVHNSGWVQCPGADVLKNTNSHNALQSYVQGIVSTFKNDERVLMWDLFNEPDNTNTGSYKDDAYGMQKAELSILLLKKTIDWVRAIKPIQPVTAAPWKDDWSDASKISALDNFMFTHSDIISFHCYENKADLEKRIQTLQQFNRPILCTEYMARQFGSTFYDVLPVLKKYNVGAYNWGLVAGKTQTHCPWDSWNTKYESEPELWFHDIFRPTGEPYDRKEVEFIKNIISHQKLLPYYQQVA